MHTNRDKIQILMPARFEPIEWTVTKPDPLPVNMGLVIFLTAIRYLYIYLYIYHK